MIREKSDFRSVKAVNNLLFFFCLSIKFMYDYLLITKLIEEIINTESMKGFFMNFQILTPIRKVVTQDFV